MTPRAIDVSHPIHEGMATYPVPWHPVVEITQLGRHGIEQRESRRIILGTHTGTHMDAPRHFIPGGPSVDAVPLDLLYGEARILDLTSCREQQELTVSDLADRLKGEHPRRLILRFDWSDRWGTMDYFLKNAYLSEESAQWLIDLGVRMLGMDTPQVDSADHGRGCAKDSPIHKIMLGQGCFFVENLRGLREVGQASAEWIVLPLNILGGDGSPCRSIVVCR